MIVRVDDLRPEGLLIDMRLEMGPLSYEGGLEIGVEGATLRGRILPSRGGLRCSGKLQATALVPCSRCLEPYAFPVVWEFDLSYLPVQPEAEPDGMELQIPREDLDVSYLDDEGSLDMTGLAAEQIYLALPMKPLCASDCRGLCPGCGSNLNIEGCHCAATV